MAFIPGPLKVTLPVVGTVYADSAETGEQSEAFDRVEFQNDRLRAARTQGAVLPQIVTLIGGIQGQIMFGEIPDFARPLEPNTYPTSYVNIKKMLYMQRATITCGSQASSLFSAVDIDALSQVCEDDLQIIQKFRNRLAIAGDPNLSYEDLVDLQSDDPANYLVGGHSLGSIILQVPPSGPSGTISLVGSNSFLTEFKVPVMGIVTNIGLSAGIQLTFTSFDIVDAY